MSWVSVPSALRCPGGALGALVPLVLMVSMVSLHGACGVPDAHSSLLHLCSVCGAPPAGVAGMHKWQQVPTAQHHYTNDTCMRHEGHCQAPQGTRDTTAGIGHPQHQRNCMESLQLRNGMTFRARSRHAH